MPRSPAPEVYIVEELSNFLHNLAENHKFRKWLFDMKTVLKEHKYSGELIKKSQIPKYYWDKYEVYNLYRYDHSEGHRSCYTIVNGCPHIFDIMTHAEYDLRFGYKTT
ncbi:hypothetical protein IMZ68_02115 [Candidatus Bathyarchaeota archaeon]|nr:hypothetical protein [Candidatus Bathyarchaeota archaeon]